MSGRRRELLFLAVGALLLVVPRPMSRSRMALGPIRVVLVLLTPLAPQPILLTGIVVVGLLVMKIATGPGSSVTWQLALREEPATGDNGPGGGEP